MTQIKHLLDAGGDIHWFFLSVFIPATPAATVYPHLFLIVPNFRDHRKKIKTQIYTGLADEKRIYIPINWNGFEKEQIG